MSLKISTILVPQGAEYQAVCRGLRQATAAPQVLSLPVGPVAVTRRIDQLLQEKTLVPGATVLVMGLCGSLVPALGVADVVLYKECQDGRQSEPVAEAGDRDLTAALGEILSPPATFVRAVTSDRVVCTAREKRQLAATWQAEVVDMEGFPLLCQLRQQGIGVATVRVVSDGVEQDLPDLSACFNPGGHLQPWRLAWEFGRKPIAALHLIQGSLKGLARLQQISQKIFAEGN